ncbi:MAG: cobalt-precorrin 5A hydrolase [Atopobiaceae bacterium]|nr:cobalt-precorrin 5A hydrolase [Atopobiaceae bacterium]
MRVSIVAFTLRGLSLASELTQALGPSFTEVRVAAPARLVAEEGVEGFDSLSSWAETTFANSDALVFVSACGIAVRAIAPHVRDKLTDPAVVCVDERGRFAISLLSGHVGGANDLARQIAARTGGEAVITTATDVERVFSVDAWAAEHDLAILDRDLIKRVSATLLEGGCVGFTCDVPCDGDVPAGLIVGSEAFAYDVGISVSLNTEKRPFDTTLRLAPRTVVVGIGCKRGTSLERIYALVSACLAEAQVASESVCALATIDIKADEEGIQTLGEHFGVPVRLYAAHELRAVEGTFASSDFVLQTVGVDNVCERAACAGGGTLLVSRRRAEGVTVALATETARVTFGSEAEAKEA